MRWFRKPKPMQLQWDEVEARTLSSKDIGHEVSLTVNNQTIRGTLDSVRHSKPYGSGRGCVALSGEFEGMTWTLSQLPAAHPVKSHAGKES